MLSSRTEVVIKVNQL